MAELDTDHNDRPVNPPKLIRTRVFKYYFNFKVVINPFEDIVPRNKKNELD